MAYPAKSWRPNQDAVIDCAIVGGGQFGLAIGFGLRREGVPSIVFDAASEGAEGPWETFARMEVLRTPKDLTGPDLGLPALGFRAWFEAQHGSEGWAALSRISRRDWMAYLRWYRDVLAIPVRNEHRLVELVPSEHSDGPFALRLSRADGTTTTVLARTVVLATGAEGSGDRVTPAFIRDSLPSNLYAHTNDAPDPAQLRGKRIGLLGAGASAFDYAAAALEAGATSADLFFRRPSLPLQNPRRWMEYAGFLAHYPELPDAVRWRYMQQLAAIGQPPPAATFDRATRQPGFRLHPGTPWRGVSTRDGDTTVVDTPRGLYEFDFIIAATGMVVDLRLRPELAHVAPHVALWRDRYAPPPDVGDARLALYPYLGRWGEFLEREPGRAPWLHRLFTITRGATLSLGPSAASNSNMKYTAPRIIAGVTRQLFLVGAADDLQTFLTANTDELDPARVAAAQAAAAHASSPGALPSEGTPGINS